MRVGMTIGLKGDRRVDYIAAHEGIPDEVTRAMTECNIRNFTIFLLSDRLFAYLEYVGDEFEHDMERLSADPATQDWQEYIMPMQQPLQGRRPDEWWSTMREVFHLD